MAWAEVTTRPIRDRRCWIRLRPIPRQAAKMRADANQNGIFRLDGPVPVLCIGRLLMGFGVRVAETRHELRVLQRLQGAGRPVDDEDGIATPQDNDLLAGGDLAQ